MTSDGGLPLNRDFAEFLVELTRAGVDYVVVGGFAVAAHGYQRATKDIDVLFRPSAENATRVLLALGAFGAPLHGVSESELAAPGLILQLGIPPRRIDLINQIDGVSFDEALVNRKLLHLAGVDVPVIGLEALLRNKRSTGRPEDLVDVGRLERLRPGD